MGRTGAYVLGGGLTLLALMAMGWSALPPRGTSGVNFVDRIEAGLNDLVVWYRSGPLDRRPDWEAASLDMPRTDPERGARLMLEYGCGACHRIPGIREAKGQVGPALDNMRRQAYVAGVLTNEPGGLVRWIMQPTVHSPQTAMPDLGVAEDEARDMAAYLYRVGGR